MGFTPFQLTFGFEAVISIEFEIPSLRTAIRHELDKTGSLQNQLLIIEKPDETTRIALWNNEIAQNRKKAQHNRLAKTTTFVRAELVMLIDSWLMKQHGQKFILKWKGPYVIHKVYTNRTYNLSTPSGRILMKCYNGTKLKFYRHYDLQAQQDLPPS
jgi:hypothetical protein